MQLSPRPLKPGVSNEHAVKSKRTFWIAFTTAVILGALIWTCSWRFTGKTEPWDSENCYYLVALLLAGLVPALISPGRFWALPFGVLLGEFIVFTIKVFQGPPAPLWPLGVVFLILYLLPTF